MPKKLYAKLDHLKTARTNGFKMVDLMRTQWNRVLKELYDWHILINSETLKYLMQTV